MKEIHTVMLSKAKRGREMAETVVLSTGSRDVFTIAAVQGVHVRYGSWFPVTFGEFERRSKVITVNQTTIAPIGIRPSTIQIIAHELGHFFAAELALDRVMEEEFARDFAAALVGK